MITERNVLSAVMSSVDGTMDEYGSLVFSYADSARAMLVGHDGSVWKVSIEPGNPADLERRLDYDEARAAAGLL